MVVSSAAVSLVRAKAVGHMAPLSRFAWSLKPRVAYLDLNLAALWKKQTTLPSFAYAGIPYQVRGERAGAVDLTIAWRRSAMARSAPFISAIFSSTSRSPVSPFFSSAAYSFTAARSSAVNRLRAVFVPAISAQLLDADQVACGIAEGAVAHPVRLRGRLLDDLGVAGLKPLECAVEVGG